MNITAGALRMAGAGYNAYKLEEALGFMPPGLRRGPGRADVEGLVEMMNRRPNVRALLGEDSNLQPSALLK